MKWFQNLKTSQKIATLVLLMTVVTLLVGTVSYRQLDAAVEDMNKMYEGSVLPISNLNQLQNESREMEQKLMEYSRPGEDFDQAKFQETMEAERLKLEEHIDAISASRLSDEEQALLNTIRETLQQYAEGMAAMNKNRQAEAAAGAVQGQAQAASGDVSDFEKNQQLLTDIGDAIEELTALKVEEAKQDTIDISEGAAASSNTSMLMTLAAIGVAAAAGWFISSQISKPMRRIALVAERVAGGDLSGEPLSLKRKDELGELAGSVDRMVESLKSLLKHAADSAEVVKESSLVLHSQALRTEEAGTAISIAARQTNEGALDQNIRVSEMTATLQEMAAAIQVTALAGEAAAAASTKSSEIAEQGTAVIGNVMANMEEVCKEIQHAAARMAELDKEAAMISSIAQDITEIAGRTNLLALNASIEAARAGEHGKGFVVVATEVRKLAEQAKESSEKAAETVKKLRQDTLQSAQLMQKNVARAESGVKAAQEAGVMFQSIFSEVDSVSAHMTDLSAAVQEAYAGSEEIVASAESLKGIAEHSAGLSERSAGEAALAVSAMKEIRSLSERLETESKELSKLMEAFTL
jgi:methyl-accepting chemotaxis protein